MMACEKEKKKRCYNTNIKRAIFSYVSKAVWDPIGCTLLHSVVQKTPTTLSANQKQNENQSRLHHSCFSRASGSLLGFTLYSHWLLLRYSMNNAFDWLDLFPSWPLIGFYHLAESSFSICNETILALCVTWLDWLVPKLSSSLPSVDILPVTPDILYNRSPSSWTELCRILQLSSNNPFSSSGKNSSMAVLAYKLTIRWPAFRDVSRTYSDSSARPLIEDEKYVKCPVSSS